MKSLMMFLAVGLLAATVAQAEEMNGEDNDRSVASEGHRFGPGHNPCDRVGLTDEQKAKIKDERFKFKESEIDLRAQLEKARLKYHKIMETPSSDIKSAKSASQEVSDYQTKLFSAKSAFKNQIAFQVLKPDQRAPAMACGLLREHGGKKRHHEGWG